MIDKQKIKIASRYSNALVELSKEKNILDKMSEDILIVKNGILESSIIKFLENKDIPKEDKKNVIKEAFQDKINEYLMNFLNILIDEKRMDIIETIIFCYEEKLDSINNIEKITVLSAINLDEGTKERISQILEKKLNKNIKINTEVDEEIISGLVIKIKDKVLDLSLKSKFENILKQLI